MKTKLLLITFGLLALAGGVSQAAQLGTAINYQGRLTDGGAPANGTHSFKYRLVGDPGGTTRSVRWWTCPTKTSPAACSTPTWTSARGRSTGRNGGWRSIQVFCSTVVIPKNGTPAALTSVQAQAAAAQAQCSANGSPQTPYRILP